ncbi:hypothetical protein V5739_13825 [Salinimicrobium sp. TIG7-5_MAKvit]|uniref:restriction endonuclease n=1 Tax=Salinimicrobium sp. TIG7-5_MAKvit TaxID=3121289 RepID=UPI003C6E2D80
MNWAGKSNAFKVLQAPNTKTLIPATGTPEVDLHKLSADEQLKIKCGKAHFSEFGTLEYRVVNKVGQLI